MIVWFEETERWGSGRLEYIGKVFRLMVRENSTVEWIWRNRFPSDLVMRS